MILEHDTLALLWLSTGPHLLLHELMMHARLLTNLLTHDNHAAWMAPTGRKVKYAEGDLQDGLDCVKLSFSLSTSTNVPVGNQDKVL